MVKKLNTFYQTGAHRTSNQICNADFVKFCVFGDIGLDPKRLAEVVDGYKNFGRPLPVNIDFTPSVDHAGYFTSGKYDGINHEDVVVKRRDGKRWQFGLLPGLPYIFPSNEWNAYIAEMAKNAIRAGAVGVTLQEIGVFGDTGYEESFRFAWAEMYGIDYPGQALWDDKTFYFMGQYLRSVYMTRQCTQILGEIAREFPTAARVIANHSAPAYYPFSNAAANHDIMALSEVTAFEAQTWSNTMQIPFYYNGVEKARPFITGLYEYGYWSNLSRQFPSKEMFFITDPKGDGFERTTLDLCHSLYRHQLAAQLIWRNVNKYNVCVWPDRSYSMTFGVESRSTPEFNAVINNVSALQGRMEKGTPVITENRPAKIAVALLDTACFQCGGPDGGITNAGLYGLFAPFVSRGIICDVLPVGESDDECDIINEYELIIVSFDTMKPSSDKFINRLSDYIRRGGAVLCVSSDGKGYDSLRATKPCGLGWWLDRGCHNPAEALLSACHVKVSGLEYGRTPSGLATASYEHVDGAEILERDESGKALAFAAGYGKGFITYYGVTPEQFAEADGSEKLYCLAARILESYGKKLPVKPYILYRRGEVASVYAASGNLSLELAADPTTSGGVWLDVFDAALSRIEKLTLVEGESAVLVDVSAATNSKVPAVMYAPMLGDTVKTMPDSLEVVVYGPDTSMGALKIFLPSDYELVSVTADDIPTSYTLDKTACVLYIKYTSRSDGLTVRVEFIKTGEK